MPAKAGIQGECGLVALDSRLRGSDGYGFLLMATVPLADLGHLDVVLTPSPGALLRRRVFGHAGLMIGLGILAAIFFLAFAAPLIAPHDPYASNMRLRFCTPMGERCPTFLLGADNQGRDMLSRIMFGLQATLGMEIGRAHV